MSSSYNLRSNERKKYGSLTNFYTDTDVKKLPYGTRSPEGKSSKDLLKRLRWLGCGGNQKLEPPYDMSEPRPQIYLQQKHRKYWLKTIFVSIFFITSCVYLHTKFSYEIKHYGLNISEKIKILLVAVSREAKSLFFRSMKVMNKTLDDQQSPKLVERVPRHKYSRMAKRRYYGPNRRLEILNLIQQTYKKMRKEGEVIQPKDRQAFIEQQCKRNYKKPQLADKPFKVGEEEKQFYADTIEDYALRSSGGEVLETYDTEPYGDSVISFHLGGYLIATIPNFWFRKYYEQRSAASVIEPWSQPGDCWAFKGTRGHVKIKLSHLIIIKAVSLEHIPLSLTRDSNIDSAPRHFAVIGVNELESSTVVKRYLGSFEYDKNGAFIQTFSLTSPEASHPYGVVELHIMSNHGKKEFTCVYRFRVHGEKFLFLDSF